MRRALLVTAATLVGVAWIVNYKVAEQSVGLVSALPPQPSPSDQPSPSAGSVSPSPTTGPTSTPSPSPSPSGAASGTFMGGDFPNQFGDVQIRLVIANGHITDVQQVQMPVDRARSAYISQVAGPLLRTEVLQAQSAQINIISGATYTSQSYAQSVESALQKAHMG